LIGFNEFTGKLVIRRSLKSTAANIPPLDCKDEVNGDTWSDLHDTVVHAILESPIGREMNGWGLRVSVRNLVEAIRLAGEQHKFHPVKDYFAALTWDKKRRVERIFVEYLRCPDEPYFRETIKLVLIAAVARIYHPGHKFDCAPILSGPQGIRKSTFIKALFGEEWTGELSAHMADDKAAVEQMLGKLCLELPELSSMRKSESEEVKRFMTVQCDRVRLAYDRRISEFPRQLVFMGTTNSAEYLKDTTGNRRWWPVPVNVDQIDTERLMSESDQIWAEAVEMYWELRKQHPADRLPLFLTDDSAIDTALALQEEFRERSHEENMADTIAEWLDTPRPLSALLGGVQPNCLLGVDDRLVVPVYVCRKQIYIEVFHGDESRLASDKGLTSSIGKAMSHVPGWKKSGAQKRLKIYRKQRVWVRDDATNTERMQCYRVVEDSSDGENDILDLV
jgi:predicted P-loop ATPase